MRVGKNLRANRDTIEDIARNNPYVVFSAINYEVPSGRFILLPRKRLSLCHTLLG